MKHKKKYGQNFLSDFNLLEKIKEVTNINKDDNIIEIGLGQGYLTQMLITNSNNVIGFEIDNDLIDYLNNKFSKYSNFELINIDFLKYDLSLLKGKYKVIANIPYYITTPIIEKLLDYKEHINEIYLMVQKEVAERITANIKTKSMGLLTHFVNFYSDTKYLFTVDKDFFNPIPKVDSAFIKIKIKKNNEYLEKIDESTYFKYIKKAFSNKRKTLVNNLSSIINKESIINILNELNKSHTVRAEELTIDEFIYIFNKIKEFYNA